MGHVIYRLQSVTKFQTFIKFCKRGARDGGENSSFFLHKEVRAWGPIQNTHTHDGIQAVEKKNPESSVKWGG